MPLLLLLPHQHQLALVVLLLLAETHHELPRPLPQRLLLANAQLILLPAAEEQLWPWFFGDDDLIGMLVDAVLRIRVVIYQFF